jgi:hypothetical protein
MPGTTTTTWTGQAGSNNFNAALNWSAGVPSATTDAEIDGTSASPLAISLAGGTDSARSLNTTFTTLELSGGALTIALASSLDTLSQSGGLLLFQNQGTAATRSTFTGPVTQTAGTLAVDSGTLDLLAPDELAGTIVGAGMLNLDGATTFDPGLALPIATLGIGSTLTLATSIGYAGILEAGNATVVFSDQTLTLNNAVDDLRKASLVGSGTLVNAGTLALDELTVGGGNVLENEGTATLAGGNLILGDNVESTAALLNDAGAVFDITGDGGIVGGAAHGYPDVVIDNAGIFEKTGGTGTSMVDARFASTGTVLANSGTLAFENSNTYAGTIAGAGAVVFDGATDMLAAGAILTVSTIVLGGGTLAAANPTIEVDGLLTGAGTVIPAIASTGDIEVSRGKLTLVGGGHGSATIDGDATLELGAAFAGSITFAPGDPSTLALDAPGDFTGTIDGLANGDTIDFKNTPVSNAAFSGSTLLVTIGTATATYDLGVPLTGSGIDIRTDAAGTGSNVVVSQPSFAPASALVNAPSTIDFGKQRAGATPLVALSVTNAAQPPAESLDATIFATGLATASGSIKLLAVGQTDTADLKAGLSTATAGITDGSVILGFASDGTGTSGRGQTSLPSQTLAVTGTVYALAAAAFLTPLIVHLGDPDRQDLTVENVATPTGFAEGLRAAVVGASGAISASGTTGLIAAGSADHASLTLDLSTATTGSVSGTVTIDLQSDGTGTSGYAPLDLGDRTLDLTMTVNSFAVATIEKTGGAGTLVANGNTRTLDFGTIQLGSAPLAADLDVRNIAAGPADLLSGSFTQSSSGVFANSGFVTFSGLGAGMAGAASDITFTPDAAGAFSETIDLQPTGSNASGFSEALPAETLVATGMVAGLAVPRIDTAAPIDFGRLRVGATAQRTLSITNAAIPQAQSLDASIAGTGAATASGSITLLAPGQTDTADLIAGLSTGAAGVANGDVTLAFSSDNGSGTVTPLAGDNADIALTGTIYNEAGFAVTPPAPVILHVGDAGNRAITVTNTAPAPFSENLAAHVLTAGGGVSTKAASTGPIAPQASADIPYTVDTTEAGTIDGSIALAFNSDGTGIDNAGPTQIGTDTLAISATVNNFATAALTASSGVLSREGNDFVLNLGTVFGGSAAQTVDLSVLNSAIGPADLLSGTLSVTSDNGFANASSGLFSNIQAGASAEVQQLSLDPTAAGSFTETLTLHSTGSNASGFNGALPDATVTVEETVQRAPGSFATVLGAGGSTVTIPFTTAANAAAAQAALSGISNAVLAGTLTQVDYTGTPALPPGVNTREIGWVELGASSVPLAPLGLGNNQVSAVLNGAAQQPIVTGLGNNTVAVGLGGAIVDNLGTNNEVFFGGGGDQTFTQVDLTSIGLVPSADVWLDGNGTFDDSVGRTLIHIGTVTGGAGDTATTLTVTNSGIGTTTVDIGSNTSDPVTALPDIIDFAGSSTVATTVNAAGGADSLGAATGGGA